MEIQIRVRGTENQIKNLLAENKLLEVLVKEGKISTDTQGDNPEMLGAIWDLSWDTIHLAHIILMHGTEDTKGRYMTSDDLLAYELGPKGKKFKSERNLSARVGGAKLVSQRHNLPEILRIKWLSGEKRYYLTQEALPSLEQIVHEEEYREDLEDKGFFFPGKEK